jgi:hypothetical protein
LLILSLLAAPAWGETVRFGFAPQAGSRWLRIGEDRVLRDMAAVAPPSETLTRQEVEVRFEALPDGSWRVLEIPRLASMEIDGLPTPNPVLDLTVGAQIELTLHADGTAKEVRGFRDLLRRFEDRLSAAQYAAVTNRMSESSLVQQEMTRWNQQLGQLLGQSVEIGEAWVVSEFRTFAMGNPEPVEGVLKFSGWSEMEGRRGVKLEYEYDNRGDAVRKLANSQMRRVDWRPQGQPSQSGNVWIRGKELRVIEPESGQLLYRTVEQFADLQPVEGVEVRDSGIMEGRFEESSVYRWRPMPVED